MCQRKSTLSLRVTADGCFPSRSQTPLRGTPDIPDPDRYFLNNKRSHSCVSFSLSLLFLSKTNKKKEKDWNAEQRAERLAAVCVCSHTNTQLCFCAESRAFTSHFCLVSPLSVSGATTLLSPPCLPLCSSSPLLSTALSSSSLFRLPFF